MAGFPWHKKKRALDALATASLSEAAKLVVLELASVVPFGKLILGEGAKAFVKALSDQTESVAKQLDKLLMMPFRTGVRLLQQAAVHPERTSEEREARRALLHDAHVHFTQALTVVSDSQGDGVLIEILDVISLAMHPGNIAIAEMMLPAAVEGIDLLATELDAMDRRAKAIRRMLTKTEQIFNAEPWSDRSFGVAEQQAYLKWRRAEVTDLEARVEEAQTRQMVLNALALIARHLVVPTGPSEIVAT